MKLCKDKNGNGCGILKEKTDFYKSKSKCKECLKTKSKENTRIRKLNMTEEEKEEKNRNRRIVNMAEEEIEEKNRKQRENARIRKLNMTEEEREEKNRKRRFENLTEEQQKIRKEKNKRNNDKQNEKRINWTEEERKEHNKIRREKITDEQRKKINKKQRVESLTKEQHEQRKEKKNQYSKTIKEKERRKNNYKKRIENDLGFKVKTTIRSRLSNFIKYQRGINIEKSITEELEEVLGCSRKFITDWIEYNITIDNLKVGEYDIDHVRPLSRFIINCFEDILITKSNHWTNLIPLIKRENLLKSNSNPTKKELFKLDLRVYLFCKKHNKKYEKIEYRNYVSD